MPWKLTTDRRITAQALERQMTHWEISRRQRQEHVESVACEEIDFITLSREVGTAAEQLARSLGERLGWPVFGKNLLEAMAGDDGVRRRIYDAMDERDLNWFEETLRPLFDRNVGVNDYFRRLTGTVMSLVRQSSCVLVGRGCDLMLPKHLGLRVRLVMPLPQRIAAIADELELEPSAAERELERIEGERIHYLRRHFGASATDPARADLTLNLGRWTTEVAVDLIVSAHARRAEEQTAAVT